MARNVSPCKGCEERFAACSARCPKDARGEYGYLAWKADYSKAKEAEAEYKKNRYEDYLRSEQCKNAQENYARSKTRQRRGKKHGR